MQQISATTTAPPAPMNTTPNDVLLGRYHAREVILGEIQRRLQETSNALALAKKEMKKLQHEQPAEDDSHDHNEWLMNIGKMTQKIGRLAATKAAAQDELHKHINSKALPLFAAPVDEVAEDCISGGIALLLEQGHERDEIVELIARQLQVNEFRFAFEAAEPEKRDDMANGQVVMFADDEDRGQTERRLAHLLGRNFPAPLPFHWIEIAAHLSDAELGAAWAWAAAPHHIEQPACIVDVMRGKLDRFERDPKLPATVKTTAEATARLGVELVVDIDDAGRVLLHAGDGPVAEVGKIDPSQTMIPVFAAVRMIGAAANGYQTTRQDWTWTEREGRARVEVAGMSGADNGGLNPPASAEEVAKTTPAQELKKQEIVGALRKHKGNLSHAARQLKVHRDSLRRRCNALNIDIESYRATREDGES